MESMLPCNRVVEGDASLRTLTFLNVSPAIALTTGCASQLFIAAASSTVDRFWRPL